ncbi:MAG: glutathione peroxidase [Ginsengibacter sp.]
MKTFFKRNKGILETIISATYPIRMKVSEMTGIGISIHENTGNKKAPVSFYSLSMISNTGHEISFERYRGKKILIVNVASKCGYTPQYAALENLYKSESNLEVLGFPTNDFGNQEPGENKEILDFCERNYGVSFPLFQKSIVSGPYKNRVFDWLTDKNKNGWNDLEPNWNFYKYIIDEHGNLMTIASSSTEPASLEL